MCGRVYVKSTISELMDRFASVRQTHSGDLEDIGPRFNGAPGLEYPLIVRGWRNKQLYGRFLAFLEILSGDSAFITLNMSPTEQLKIVAEPITFTSPVTTALPDDVDDDHEETDESVLAGRDLPPEDMDGEGDSEPS